MITRIDSVSSLVGHDRVGSDLERLALAKEGRSKKSAIKGHKGLSSTDQMTCNGQKVWVSYARQLNRTGKIISRGPRAMKWVQRRNGLSSLFG